MPDSVKDQNGSIYQITLQGNLDAGWSTWFNWMVVSFQEESHITTFIGPISDQAELRGILNKLWDLNKSIIDVSQIQDRI